MTKIISKLIKVSNKLDELGLTKDADLLDLWIKKI